VTRVTVTTSDGISHRVSEDQDRGSGWIVRTACGIEVAAWRYKGKPYGIWRPGEIIEELPEQRLDGLADCMACVCRTPIAE
jgi:hypothetical protein